MSAASPAPGIRVPPSRSLWRLAPVLALLLGGGACDDAPPPTGRDALETATYMVPDADESIVLREGAATDESGTEYELMTSAEGDLDFDGEPDAAAVLIETRGDARLLRLHALLSDGERTQDVAARLIGDRVGVQGLSIEDGVVRAELMLRASGEPITVRPTVPYTQHFVLTDRGLTPTIVTQVADGEAARSRDARGEPRTPDTDEAGAYAPALHTHEWVLEGMERAEEPADLSVLDEPVRVRFLAELADPAGASGQITGFAGCNRVFGGFRAEESSILRTAGLATTRRTCRSAVADFEAGFLAALAAVERYDIMGEQLTLYFEGGSLELRAGGRLIPAEAEPPAPRSPSPAPEAEAGRRSS